MSGGLGIDDLLGPFQPQHCMILCVHVFYSCVKNTMFFTHIPPQADSRAAFSCRSRGQGVPCTAVESLLLRV